MTTTWDELKFYAKLARNLFTRPHDLHQASNPQEAVHWASKHRPVQCVHSDRGAAAQAHGCQAAGGAWRRGDGQTHTAASAPSSDTSLYAPSSPVCVLLTADTACVPDVCCAVQIPGPQPHQLFLLGNIPNIMRPDYHVQILDWANEYGGIYKFSLGCQWVVVISDPQLAAQVGYTQSCVDAHRSAAPRGAARVEQYTPSLPSLFMCFVSALIGAYQPAVGRGRVVCCTAARKHVSIRGPGAVAHTCVRTLACVRTGAGSRQVKRTTQVYRLPVL